MAKIIKANIKEVLKEVNKKQFSNIRGRLVKINTKTIKTFYYKGTTCACCGLEAKYFKINKPKNGYSNATLISEVNGKEIKFTRDHIIPKSLGGNDTYDNMQTMCEECNNAKGSLGKSNLHSKLVVAGLSKGKKNGIAKIVNASRKELANRIVNKELGLYKIGLLSKFLGVGADELLLKRKIDSLSFDIEDAFNEGREKAVWELNEQRKELFKKLRKVQKIG